MEGTFKEKKKTDRDGLNKISEKRDGKICLLFWFTSTNIDP